jgi:coproporphyrinogen III oxidase
MLIKKYKNIPLNNLVNLMNNPVKELIAKKFLKIQAQICETLEKADGKGKFSVDHWEKNIGSGITRVMQDGEKIAKAAVNYSFVSGEITPRMYEITGKKEGTYTATGVSSIIHPVNPFVPIIHMNIRYFELSDGTSWFGGGIDLTPHYIDINEAIEFHTGLKKICDKYHPAFYPDFKKWADDYFFIKHRGEARGVGGIFFDRVKPGDKISMESLIEFTNELGNAYPAVYSKILNQKSHLPYGEKEVKWQNFRRSRYVEFNLVWDLGTKFGIESGGNAESILVSMPPVAEWGYNFQPAENTEEYRTMQLLKQKVDWLKLEKTNKNSKTPAFLT